jgi:ParB-like chromosome segregation protein Spo0J
MLADDELRALADDIRTHGLIESVWLYDDPERGTVLLDGRNRVRACELAGVAVLTRTYIGDDPISFSISQNVQRRHLTTGQKAAVAHDALPLFEAEAKRRSLANLRQNAPDCADLHSRDGDKPKAKRSADRAAKSTGTSGRAVGQYKRIAEQAPELAERVKAGTMALDRAERVIRDREAEQKRIEHAQREAVAQPQVARIDIRHGDFREVLADLANVDAIITDPPYPAEFLPLLADLAEWADRVLARDGVLAVLIGQTHLPEVFRLLSGHRPYRWTAAYMTPGNGYVSHPRKVQSNWKPLLIYGGGPRFADVVRSEGEDAAAKDNHKWGQDYGAFHQIIERLTERGQTVVDPFMGSGTTLLAAHALGRHAIGADVDEDSVRSARCRLYG